MGAPRKYPQELRDRAKRMVAEAMAQEPDLSLNAAVLRIGPRVGVVPDTLRGWVKQARIDGGQAPGTSTAEAATVKQLQTEVRELKRANEILLEASSFFASMSRQRSPRTSHRPSPLRRAEGGSAAFAGLVARCRHRTASANARWRTVC